jgi:hypothetical protein
MFDEIREAIREIQQPRSRFQLERFVLGQHSTPEMRYYQLCIELQNSIYNYEVALVDQQIRNKKIEKLLSTGDEIDALKARKLQLANNETSIVVLGAEREIAHLVDMWKLFTHKYTRDEIEATEPNYWKARLTANAEAMVLGQGAVNPAHIEAMAQAGVLENYLEQVKESNELRNLES